MKIRLARTLTAAASTMIATAGPVLAHHSFVAEFDAGKPVTLVGVVTKLDWRSSRAHPATVVP